MAKRQYIKIPRYNGKHEVWIEETNSVPELLTPALKEIKAYLRAYGRMQKATKKLLPVMTKAFKSRSVDDLLDIGDFLSRLHISSAHYFFERAFRLDPSQMKKRGLTS
jgi:cytochrome c553